VTAAPGLFHSLAERYRQTTEAIAEKRASEMLKITNSPTSFLFRSLGARNHILYRRVRPNR